jgi:hypothetical protein
LPSLRNSGCEVYERYLQQHCTVEALYLTPTSNRYPYKRPVQLHCPTVRHTASDPTDHPIAERSGARLLLNRTSATATNVQHHSFPVQLPAFG